MALRGSGKTPEKGQVKRDETSTIQQPSSTVLAQFPIDATLPTMIQELSQYASLSQQFSTKCLKLLNTSLLVAEQNNNANKITDSEAKRRNKEKVNQKFRAVLTKYYSLTKLNKEF